MKFFDDIYWQRFRWLHSAHVILQENLGCLSALVVSSGEEINISTILNGFRVSFGEDDVLEIEENEMEVTEKSPHIAEVLKLATLLQNFAVKPVIKEENTDVF